MKRVAITGMGVITCFGDSPATLHSALCNEEKASYGLELSEWPDSNCRQGGKITCFQAESYLQGKSLRPLDRTGRIVASAAKLALENSGWVPEMLRQHDVGLALGTMFGSMHTISAFDRHGLTAGPSYVSPMDFANTVLNAAAGQTAIWHNLRGINSTIACGVTSGLMALGYAADLIRYGGHTALLAGGADEFCVEAWCGFERAGLLGNSNGLDEFPVPFSARRNGFALGEGAALLMLEQWDAAEERGASILGEIRGHGSSYDLRRNPDCGPDAIARAMDAALRDSQMCTSDIHCLSASANGSVVTDLNEALAIHTLFNGSAESVPVTAIKSMLGEALGASGALQVVDVLETLRSHMLPGIRGLEHHAPEIPALHFCRKKQPLPGHSGLVNSVGIDGNICSLVVSAIPERNGNTK
jgi:3-oxoacyl-[acyl-carrier-protein] synthase II